MTNIKIKEVALYHPTKVVDNSLYEQHFTEKGRDITHFLQVMGKKNRHIIDKDNENSLSMAIEASHQVLMKANMNGKDIDYIVFATQTPEYTFPSNAMFIHDAIRANPQSVAIDMNANCAGMTVAVEQASRYMLSNSSIQTALVIGSDYLSLIANPEQEITYATYGDAACAVILEKTMEQTGFIDSSYQIVTAHVDKIIYPQKGFSQSIKADGRYIHFEPFDASFSAPIIINLFDKILERNSLKITDISAVCISQFAFGDKLKLEESYLIDSKKVIYIGDQFGYTGSSSPFIAFHEGVQDGRIKRGDYVMFWTVGAGHQFIAMLWKY